MYRHMFHQVITSSTDFNMAWWHLSHMFYRIRNHFYGEDFDRIRCQMDWLDDREIAYHIEYDMIHCRYGGCTEALNTTDTLMFQYFIVFYHEEDAVMFKLAVC